MKKLIWALVGVVGLLGLAATSASAANPTCSSDDLYCVSTSSATEGSGNPLTALTDYQYQIFKGILAIGPKDQGSTPGLYVVFDGFEGNVNPLDGYLGISTADLEKTLALVGSPEGNFNRAGGNDSAATLLGFVPTDPNSLNFNAIIIQAQGLAPNLSFFETGQMPALPTNLVELGHLSLPALIH